MEKQIKELLKTYTNRQVILNYYHGEELTKRDGFHFNSIMIKHDSLNFIKSSKVILTINLNEFPEASISWDFQHYFVLRKGNERLDVYFP
ncbi:hypothetical protein [Cytobacillus oceanisediminis]|uniref:hypothetical protein n=1 Tax=Cytobacillus oceanisediminis TaxID=665099 RepID=UPI003734C28E